VAATERVIAEDAIRVLDHGFVRLDGSMATDLSVVNAARVSFARRKDQVDEADEGLIRFLMRDRHGCYDDATEVLTEDGWMPWPRVKGDELFATRTIDGRLEYQPALRLVRKEYRGHMVGFCGMSLDLLVTPDHRVLAAQMTTREGRTKPRYTLRPAHSVLWKSHRHVTTADWGGVELEFLSFAGHRFAPQPFMKLVGFFIADGFRSASNHIVFNLRKSREITYLHEIAANLGLEVRQWKNGHLAVSVPGSLRSFFDECYDANRQKVVPPRLLGLARGHLAALYEGLLQSDGSVYKRGHGRADRQGYYTTSKRLADQVQELALKLGRSASVRPHVIDTDHGHYGQRARWRVTIYADRNTRPAICRTRADADNQMGVDFYDGTIHCVEVPNHTLYVRRNGYAVWSGNTPFEHNAFRFHVRAPIFVAREWFRHRVGSFNEFSMRYAKATDDFYVPEPEDVRSQVGKPGAYSFEPVDDELAERTREELREVYEAAFATYERLVEAGVARELARSVMPVGAYTEFFWTVNARALMNFVSLRAAETAQREIRRYADAVEHFFAEQMPVTHGAFVAAGRVAP
jgi:thymidylate synthase (FAD)